MICPVGEKEDAQFRGRRHPGGQRQGQGKRANTVTATATRASGTPSEGERPFIAAEGTTSSAAAAAAPKEGARTERTGEEPTRRDRPTKEKQGSASGR